MSITLNYRNTGSGDPLIILHGLLGNHRNWLTIAKTLAASFEVYLPDARNHGESTHHNQMDYLSLMEDLRCFIEQHQISPMTLIGHSMGGKTAMFYGLMYPEKVKHLIVIDIAPVNYGNDLIEVFDLMQNLDLVRINNRSDALSYFNQHIHDYRFSQYLVSNLKRSAEGFKWRVNLPVLISALRELRSFPDIAEDRMYTGPVTFIKGDQSNYIDEQYQPAILERFPNAVFRTIRQSGHNPHVDQPQQLLDVLKARLNS